MRQCGQLYIREPLVESFSQTQSSPLNSVPLQSYSGIKPVRDVITRKQGSSGTGVAFRFSLFVLAFGLMFPREAMELEVASDRDFVHAPGSG